jgi:hypothetical protein
VDIYWGCRPTLGQIGRIDLGFVDWEIARWCKGLKATSQTRKKEVFSHKKGFLSV